MKEIPSYTATIHRSPGIGPIKKATWWTIVQSGNWDANRLWVNDMNWSGICNGTPHKDLDIDMRVITEHLGVGKNTIRFQAVEDYAVLSGSFLVVEIEPPVEGATTSISSGPSAEGTSESKGIPGFKVMPAIGLALF